MSAYILVHLRWRRCRASNAPWVFTVKITPFHCKNNPLRPITAAREAPVVLDMSTCIVDHLRWRCNASVPYVPWVFTVETTPGTRRALVRITEVREAPIVLSVYIHLLDHLRGRCDTPMSPTCHQ